MIIGFDGSRAFTDNRTGTENYSFQILRHLAEIDHNNTYIVYLRPGQKPNATNVISNTLPLSSRVSASWRKREISGLYEISLPDSIGGRNDKKASSDNHGWPSNFHFKTLSYPRLWTQFGLAVQTWRDPLDVLFVTAHTLPLIHRPSLKTVMVAHDLGAEYLPGMHQLKQRLYLNFITNFQFKSATRVIAVSEATKHDLIAKAGVDRERISVIYEGIDTEHFKVSKGESKSKILHKYNLKEQSFFFFLGTIQPRKNLFNLIKAFGRYIGLLRRQMVIKETNGDPKNDPPSVSSKTLSLINNPKLVIAGSKGWKSDQIYALPKKLGIEDSVIFTGRISDSEAITLYSSATAFTYPSLFEGFGLPILEAFALDCPVITSDISSMPEVAGDAAILVDPQNIRAISQAMSQVTDPETRQTLISRGRKQLTKFSWLEAAKQTLKVLED